MNIAMNVMVKKGHHSVDISTYTEIICKSELLMGGGAQWSFIHYWYHLYNIICKLYECIVFCQFITLRFFFTLTSTRLCTI